MSKLVFFVGPAGAGKTTLGQAIAARHQMTFLDMDILLRPASRLIMTMQGLDPDDRDSPEYKRLCRDLGYQITMEAALDNVRLGIDTVVVGPFTKEMQDAEWISRELARIGFSVEEVDVKAAVVYLPHESLYQERIARRGLKLDAWKLERWEEFRSSLAPRTLAWRIPESSIAYINNSNPDTEKTLMQIENWIWP
ncbi:ATP-binding protein [Paenibacillus sp. JX-17]|uniref:ATP-binding protein n=1 Tax=Paenibacillus lacisoli TaxID=3064525 RepID=A0ABT9CET1_9BACL|nr:ATP-binding protein [Paenibacillus sp. JX-17]MDO7907787.1 ATP-binding protein [Paenibacillus sp. JX-17]